jgi:hypothetical protein
LSVPTTTTPTTFAHRFTRRLTLFVVQLSIAVGVEFFNHLRAHVAVPLGTIRFVLSPRPAGEQHWQTKRQQK